MNYIDITQSSQTLNINLKVDGADIDILIYKDGSDTLVVDSSSEVVNRGYYQEIELDSVTMERLKDETQYNIVGVNPVSRDVVYRGKFQTTSKDIQNYSVNENKYTPKVNPNNYTILD